MTADSQAQISTDGRVQMTADSADGGFLYKDLTFAVRGAVYEVYNTLGPGFKEDVYHRALAHELTLRHVPFREQPSLTVLYKGQRVGTYEPDFVIAESVIVEIKAVPRILSIFEAQLSYYLKGTDYRLGLLVNFGASQVDIRRRIFDRARHPRPSSREVLRQSAHGNRRPSASPGQAVMEYAILVGLVVAAVAGMQTYFKRGLQAGVKLAADRMAFDATPAEGSPLRAGEAAQIRGMTLQDDRRQQGTTNKLALSGLTLEQMAVDGARSEQRVDLAQEAGEVTRQIRDLSQPKGFLTAGEINALREDPTRSMPLCLAGITQLEVEQNESLLFTSCTATAVAASGAQGG